MRRAFAKPLLIFAALVAILPTQLVFAQPGKDCQKYYEDVVTQSRNADLTVKDPTPQAVKQVRGNLVRYLKEAGVPAFVRKTKNGDLPIVLLNKETYPRLGYILDNSLGMAASLHPGGRTDHGMFRNRTKLIDLYNPGDRWNSGEFHRTGIAWKDLQDYLPRRKADSRNILDLSYLVSLEEREAMEYYHRTRRAAVFRAPYANWGSKIEDHPQFLCGGGEHCYTFPIAAGAQSHVSEMHQRIGKLGVKDPQTFMASRSTKDLLGSVKRQVLDEDADNYLKMEYKALLDRPETLEKLDQILGENTLKKEQKIEMLAYMVGIDATRQYKGLLDKLSIEGGYSNILQYDNPRATALFIYDDSPTAAQRFNDGTYETISDNYSFRNDGKNSPLPQE